MKKIKKKKIRKHDCQKHLATSVTNEYVDVDCYYCMVCGKKF